MPGDPAPDFDPLAQHAQAQADFWQAHSPPDARGAVDEVTDLSALDRGPGIRVVRDDWEPPSPPSLIVEGGRRPRDRHRKSEVTP